MAILRCSGSFFGSEIGTETDYGGYIRPSECLYLRENERRYGMAAVKVIRGRRELRLHSHVPPDV
jgi:hypothetical protein